ncbi:MAG: S-methyl-5-thioribose-1-phosphate isomerase [bacterium]
MIKTLEWKGDSLELIDQRKLPLELEVVKCKSYRDVADAIREMKIRGAPAIGVASAFGVALGARAIETSNPEEFLRRLDEVIETLRGTRPTAVNLFWALDRMRAAARNSPRSSVGEIKSVLTIEALRIYDEDIRCNRRIGELGADLLKDGDVLLTHCNAGALATAGAYGTALSPIRIAAERGKHIEVFVDETRPFLQGARLTAWELLQDGIPATLITDNMAGYFMKEGAITGVIVGADRIARNGDVANKIGTYTVAVLAHRHNIPFYVAAPVSTLDLSLSCGDEIPIEERSPEEVTHLYGKRVAPEGVRVRNPAFDVTPHDLVTAIITDRGIAREPYDRSLPEIAGGV